ncbi:MAG: DNA replication and repair protein RecF [Bacteroidota bacterium]
MKLNNLHLINFKNYAEADFQFDAEICCFTGKNGSGKTNLLDAIHYLSLCKSHFNPADSQNIKHEEEFFVVEGEFEVDEQIDRIFCAVKKGQAKSFKRNKKAYDKLSDHIGRYPSVMITPNDVDLLKGGSEERRKFIDKIICQYDKRYLEYLMSYNKVLQQRNNLLKYFQENRTFDQEQLDVWNEQLVDYGAYLFTQRKAFLTDFEPLFSDFYAKISEEAESVSIEYKSQLFQGNFEDLLISCQQEDRRRAYSTLGLHKDDLILKIGDYPIKKFGSQGQQKSLIISMRLAQFQFMKNVTKITPVLLLDDIFDKLDDYRVKSLMELVSDGMFGQIFITDTSDERMLEIFNKIGLNYALFPIRNGQCIKEESLV